MLRTRSLAHAVSMEKKKKNGVVMRKLELRGLDFTSVVIPTTVRCSSTTSVCGRVVCFPPRKADGVAMRAL